MSDTVQQIKDRLDILEVLTPYVELHKAGKHYKGRCPFHSEKTPSFTVSPDRGLYHCYGCSAGGDMFTFVQEIEGVDFKGALKLLADKAGVELVPEDPKQKTERDRLFALLDATTRFFADQLAQMSAAQAYLERRGVSAKTIAAWQIGYAPGPPTGGWRELKDHLTHQGYTTAEMLKAGVVKQTDAGKDPFDVFRDRVMFPMATPQGQVVAFSGRILSVDSEAPKYVNSPETVFYKKSELLFGYDKAKHGIRNLDFSLIVEGQFDVVMCHQAGYTNTVAVSGTALTSHHVGLLERLSSRVLLALDADRAGIAAMKKAAEVMLRRGLDVKIAHMPDGQDPADIIARDPQEFKSIIKQAEHVIPFFASVLKAQSKDERAFKLQVREEVLPLIAVMPNRLDQDHFVGEIATALGASKDAIQFEVSRWTERLEQQTQVAQSTTVTKEVGVGQGATDVELPSRIDKLTAQLAIMYELAPSEMQPIAERYTQLTNTTLESVDLASPAERSALTFTIEAYLAELTSAQKLEYMFDIYKQFRATWLKAAVTRVRHELTKAEAMVDEDRVHELLQQLQQLQTQLADESLTLESVSGVQKH